MGEIETLDRVVLEGKKRLYPAIWDPHWLVLRRRRLILQDWIANLPGEKLFVLDVGGRIQPYRPLLEGRLAGYIATDLRRTPLVHVVSRGEQLPFRPEQFWCTRFLESLGKAALFF